MAFSIVQQQQQLVSAVDPALQDASTTVKKQPQQESSSKKSVRFADTRKVFYRHRGQNSTPANKLWYKSKDFQLFRANFTKDAKQVARSMRKFEQNVVLTAFQDCQDKPQQVPSANAALQTFLEDPTHRGLERMAAREIYCAKSMAIKEIRHTVMHIQTCELGSYSAEANMLRRNCARITRSSAAFAQCIAQQRLA
mmetsp:Transcript_19319/g.41569  ORF Transcript_19319/g.41569 Transcript_19319/m.41569 type:complete len:196 (+) Transcript_19319:93-680(+)